MRSRRNNTTLTRKVDKWNPRKVWLIKRYADGHYAINQEVGGRVFYSSYQRATKHRSPRSSPAAEEARHEQDQQLQIRGRPPLPWILPGDSGGKRGEPCIVEASVYRLNAVAAAGFMLDGPDGLAWAKIGIAAAEQIYVGQGRGDEKKQYVLEFLKSKGFDLNEESVNNAIEAAVKQLNTEGLLID